MKQEDAHVLFDLLRMPLDALRHETGSGRVGRSPEGIRLAMGAPEGGRYHNAQVDDYHQAGGGQQRWGPPLHLRVQARFSHDRSELHGTAGFGFWNDPFGMTQSGRLRLPRALWFFFGGPATDLPLAYGVPGQGWKAATLDTLRGGALALLPVAPLAVPLLNIPALYRRMWPRVQRRLRIGEALVPAAMDDWPSMRSTGAMSGAGLRWTNAACWTCPLRRAARWGWWSGSTTSIWSRRHRADSDMGLWQRGSSGLRFEKCGSSGE